MFKHLLLPLAFVALASAVHSAVAAPPVSVEQCPPNPLQSYDQYVKFAREDYASEVEDAKSENLTMAAPSDSIPKLLSKDEFDARIRYEGFECQRLTYMSDGLRVVAYHWKPKNPQGKVPLIIFARGGSRDFGKVKPWSQWGFYTYLKAGFAVIAPQYRGNDGGEGREEFGGADVRDLFNVLPLAQSLPYVDSRNVFLFGRSRGGMMTCLAIKQGMSIRAAAIDAPLVNLFVEAKRRPLLVKENWSKLIPGFTENPEEKMRERSAVLWADSISVPLLMLQGGDDWRASPSETLHLATELAKHQKKFEFHYYANDDHQLSNHRADADQRVIEWFRLHMAE